MENTTNNKCPKCGEEMEEGMILDKAGGYSQSEWGTKIKMLGATVEGKRKIVTFRCGNCGFLESFAK